MGSSEEKGTSAGVSGKTGDSRVDELREQLRADWERQRARDKANAEELGRRIVAHVRMEQAAKAVASERRSRVQVRGLNTEDERTEHKERLAEHQAALAETAGAVQRKHARKRYKTPAALEAAVRDQCAAEFGTIMGFAFDEEKLVPFLQPVAELSATVERHTREVYTRLRKAINEARALAYRLSRGAGGPAGRALFYMRGVLPVLPPLTEPPFDQVSPTGRAALVREWDERVRELYGKELADRELAVFTLLWGQCPRGTYKALLKGKPGMTVNQVLAEEVKRVARVRKPPPEGPT